VAARQHRRFAPGRRVEALFWGPYNLNVLPLSCARTATWDGTQPTTCGRDRLPVTFAFAADRTVFGAFAALQWRATPRLIFDAGAASASRARALGTRGYAPQPLGEAASSRIHPRLAREAELHPGLPAAGLQQHRLNLPGGRARRSPRR